MYGLSTFLYDLSYHLLITHIWTLLSQVPRKFTSKVEGKMGYEDFVYFILSEEDKSSEPSLEYWYFVSHSFFLISFVSLSPPLRCPWISCCEVANAWIMHYFRHEYNMFYLIDLDFGLCICMCTNP